MTFHEKLDALHAESINNQKEFLLVIGEIRALATKGEALPEELIHRRETLYQQFNKILKTHRRLLNYIEEHLISRTSEYTEGMEWK